MEDDPIPFGFNGIEGYAGFAAEGHVLADVHCPVFLSRPACNLFGAAHFVGHIGEIVGLRIIRYDLRML